MKITKVITLEKNVPSLGKKIKAARMSDKRMLTQICRECGLSRSYWYQIESNGVKKLSLETLQKIESVLGVDFGIKFDE